MKNLRLPKLPYTTILAIVAMIGIIATFIVLQTMPQKNNDQAVTSARSTADTYYAALQGCNIELMNSMRVTPLSAQDTADVQRCTLTCGGKETHLNKLTFDSGELLSYTEGNTSDPENLENISFLPSIKGCEGVGTPNVLMLSRAKGEDWKVLK